MEAGSGDVLAVVSAPARNPPAVRTAPPTPDQLLDRARYGQYPPGSTFKLVTAIAALRVDRRVTHRTFQCRPLGDGRCGNIDRRMESRHQRRHRRSRARHDRYGARHRGLLQRVLRAARCTRRRCEGAGGDGGAARNLHRRSRGVAPRSALRRLRSGASRDHAIQDGARGGHDRRGRPDAARPLGRRRRQSAS